MDLFDRAKAAPRRGNLVCITKIGLTLPDSGITLAPTQPERVEEIDRIIRDELNLGIVSRQSERTLKTFITNFDQEGVKAVVIGAAELLQQHRNPCGFDYRLDFG